MASAGQKIGHYLVLAKLGEGGMGEVWRATDTRLNREVAIKVLPAAVANDALRLARFTREAQVLASLNHPGIAAIYGVEEHALVMELVEGPTLAERIGSPAMTVDDVLPIARQMAEALAYAHDKGVVHRDLKPANIKVTPDGTVKILDFGLAKAMSTDASSSGPGDATTVSAATTLAGTVLGTAAYMAPEQARGQNVDRRADIWAYGVVLYEMLTGERPFGGPTITDTLAAVLTKEPEMAPIPAPARALVRRCLQKDPRKRLQAIGDAEILLEPGSAAALPRARWPLLAAGSVAALAIAAAVTLAVVAHRALTTPPQPALRAEIAPPTGLLFGLGVALAPDGSMLAFPERDVSGQTSLWVRPLDSTAARELPGSAGATYPFWSPDGRQIGFFQNGHLMRTDLGGSPPVEICPAPNARGGTWSQNGVIIFAPQSIAAALEQVPAAGGTPTPVTSTPSGFISDRWPVFLPDGRHFLFLSGNLLTPGTNRLGIYLGELGSKQAQFLLQADSQALYASGYLLFLRGSTLLAEHFDPATLKLSGGPAPLAQPVISPEAIRLGQFTSSQEGLLVYAPISNTSYQLNWLDAAGKILGQVGPTGAFSPRLSPNGKQLAYAYDEDLWIADVGRGSQMRLTFGPENSQKPTWSPNGSRIAFAALQGNGAWSELIKSSSGSGAIEAVARPALLAYPTDWSRDGRFLLFDVKASDADSTSIWVMPMTGDQKSYPYVQSPASQASGVFSPDERWVAYASNESGRPEIYITSFPGGGDKWQVSQTGGDFPRWKGNGSALYFLAPGGKMMEASVREQASAVSVGSPHTLFTVAVPPAGTLAEAERTYPYDVASDGQRFVVETASSSGSVPLTVVTHWPATLEH